MPHNLTIKVLHNFNDYVVSNCFRIASFAALRVSDRHEISLLAIANKKKVLRQTIGITR